jgi:hypothetical protein
MVEKSSSEANDLMKSFGFADVMEMQRPALAAMAEINSRLCESIAAVNKEWASFIDRRLREDLAVPQQLAECKTVQDYYQVYAQFFQNACAQYQSGFEQMTKLSRSIAETALRHLQSHSESHTRH